MLHRKFYFIIILLNLYIALCPERNVYASELMAEGGYSKVTFGENTFEGENASLRIYFFPGSAKTFQFLLGLGVRGEMTQGSQSTSTYSYTSKYSIFQVGGDVGFKINPTNWLNLYTVISLNISPYAAYENDLTVGGSTQELNPNVNSDWNIGASFKASVNLSNRFAIGGSILAARGVSNYADETYNNVTISGSSGGYNILNYNIIISFLFN
ncbi:hypothetical protein [Fluviispira sanaruensis]|uniref:Outer membrane protein beta-barrel domain-containing protein n=1 Tax=Fluviispira sanaruensis TaxID=2493639 RepID=A0A4P2VMT9_FLUSA|nr:hypothetical protein [Fluviispira sanaruensis]BBH52819.1 hypothetical protein JCM31447_12620 [Fluviispira sanaruensis]